MGKIETVKIKADNKDGYIVINKSDILNKHTLFSKKEVLRINKKKTAEGK